MECNRDEAIRAREIAEKKFTMQDFAGAKKFIHKAQQLYPALEGVSQWLAVIEVHIVSQTKVGSSNNETDWYGILQVLVPFCGLTLSHRVSFVSRCFLSSCILLYLFSDERSMMPQSTGDVQMLIASFNFTTTSMS